MRSVRKGMLLLFISLSLVFPASAVYADSSDRPIKMMEIKSLIWDKNYDTWNNMIYAHDGDTLRCKIILTYHDPDGDGPSYKIKWISIEEDLPQGLKYVGNSTLNESYVSRDYKIIKWENISGIELFDGESLSLEYHIRILSPGTHIFTVRVKAFETCPHVWHFRDTRSIVFVIDHIAHISRDVDNDGDNETATDSNMDLRDGFEKYTDSDNSSKDIKKIDGDRDGKIDHFIDLNGDEKPEKYWDPDDDILSDVIIKDVDNDSTEEWLFDSDGDGIRESYYDPNDGSIHFLDVIPPVIKIVIPKKGYIYRSGMPIRKSLSGSTRIYGPINIKVDAYDRSGIDKVEFYIDGKLMHTDKETPYTWLWIAKPLRLKRVYTIEVKAYDLYGNVNTDNITVMRYRSRALIAVGAISAGFGILIEKIFQHGSKENNTKSPRENPPSKAINYPPEAIIDAPNHAYTNESVEFNASQSYDSDGKIVKYVWDFGDGHISNEKVTTHTYLKSGRYKVSLEVIDDKGAKDTKEITLEISTREHTAPLGRNDFLSIVALLSIVQLIAVPVVLRRR